MYKPYVTFAYPINDPNAFEIIDTDMSKAGIISTVEAYLQSCIDADKDDNLANELEVYQIIVENDLIDDTFTVISDCGNLKLVADILIDILRRLHEDTKRDYC